MPHPDRRQRRAAPEVEDAPEVAPPPAPSAVAGVLQMQRSAGNAAVSRALLQRNGPTTTPAPAGPVTVPAVFLPAPTVFADRVEMVAAVTVKSPKTEDLWGGVKFLNGQSLTEMVSIAKEVARSGNLQRLRHCVGSVAAINADRIVLVMDAVLSKGAQGRLSFEEEHTKELVAVGTEPDVNVVLDLLGPSVPEFQEMKKTLGYQALYGTERTQLAFLIAGSTSMSKKAAAAMRKLLDDPKVDKADPEPFRRFISGDAHLSFDTRLPGEARLPRDKYTLGAPTDVAAHPYRSGPAAAVKTTVEITGKNAAGAAVVHSIEIFAPKSFKTYKKGRVLPTAAEVAEVLAELPVPSRDAIKRVDLHPVRNPDDAYWLAQPEYAQGGKDFVSHMTAGSDGTVDVFPSTANASMLEIETTMLHESGHVVSNKAWGDDNKDAKWDPWRQAMKADGLKLSKYATSSESEDFAEAWVLFAPAYLSARRREVKALIPNRFALMEGLVTKTP